MAGIWRLFVVRNTHYVKVKFAKQRNIGGHRPISVVTALGSTRSPI
jgi:hypothetical protein